MMEDQDEWDQKCIDLCSNMDPAYYIVLSYRYTDPNTTQGERTTTGCDHPTDTH